MKIKTRDEKLQPFRRLWTEQKEKAGRGERPLHAPYGRWLGDFLDQPESTSGLLPAELVLLEACVLGEGFDAAPGKAIASQAVRRVYDAGEKALFAKAAKSNRVRAAFLRFLALGGDDFAPVHEVGVELHGAYIDRDIDLIGCACVKRLALIHCFVDGALIIEDASLGVIALQGCHVKGIQGNRARISGSMLLDKLDRGSRAFTSEGKISFVGAEISGSFQASEARVGAASFYAARIGGDLCFSGAQISNPGGFALHGDAIHVGGCVFLNQSYDGWENSAPDDLPPPFEAEGKVSFVGATVGLQFICQGGRFRNASPDPHHETYADLALDLSASTIKNKLVLGVEEPEDHRQNSSGIMPLPAAVEGSVSLLAASAGDLADAGFIDGGEAGLKKSVRAVRNGLPVELTCNLQLDNFTYDRLDGDGALRVGLRAEWLARQPDEHLGEDFRPQPFEQLVKVLRAMGHQSEADEIALLKRKYAWRARPWFSRTSPWAFITKGVELALVSWFLGYGYRIGRALLILLVLGCGYGAIYKQAFDYGAFAPSDKELRQSEAGARCRNWSAPECLKAAENAPFNPWVYSFDVMTPVVGLGQKSAWHVAADGSSSVRLFGLFERPLSSIYYVQLTETVLGWIGGLLLASFVGGFVKKE